MTLDDAANDGGGLFSVKVGDASTSATNAGAIAAAAVELQRPAGQRLRARRQHRRRHQCDRRRRLGRDHQADQRGRHDDQVAGALSAQGANGAGGQIETSGETLDIGAAQVDTHGGSWLLDPTDLIVDATAAGVIDGALGSGNVTLQTFATGAPSGPAGSTGNTASGAGDILVEHALTWSTGSTLTLNAYSALDHRRADHRHRRRQGGAQLWRQAASASTSA